MKRILALFALLFATSAFGVDNPISCTGLPCRVTILPKSTTGTTVSGFYVDGSVAINSTNVLVGGPATTPNTGANAFNPTVTIGATDGGAALSAGTSYAYKNLVGEGDVNGYEMVWYELDKGGTKVERMRFARNSGIVSLGRPSGFGADFHTIRGGLNVGGAAATSTSYQTQILDAYVPSFVNGGTATITMPAASYIGTIDISCNSNSNGNSATFRTYRVARLGSTAGQVQTVGADLNGALVWGFSLTAAASALTITNSGGGNAICHYHAIISGSD